MSVFISIAEECFFDNFFLFIAPGELPPSFEPMA